MEKGRGWENDRKPQRKVTAVENCDVLRSVNSETRINSNPPWHIYFCQPGETQPWKTIPRPSVCSRRVAVIFFFPFFPPSSTSATGKTAIDRESACNRWQPSRAVFCPQKRRGCHDVKGRSVSSRSFERTDRWKLIELWVQPSIYFNRYFLI